MGRLIRTDTGAVAAESSPKERTGEIVARAPGGGRLVRIGTASAPKTIRTALSTAEPEGLSLPTLSESVKGKGRRMETGRNQVEGLPSARTPTAYQENAVEQAERIRGILDSGRTSDGRAVTPGMEKTLREALSKYEAQAKDPNGGFLTRLENTVKGGAKGFLSGHMDAMGTLYQSGQAGRTARDAETLEEYQAGAARAERELEELLAQDGLSAREVLAGLPKEDGLLSTKRKDYLAAAGVQDPADVLAVVNVLEDYRRKAEAMEKAPGIQEQAGEAARDLAAAVQRSGAQDIERAKAGKGLAQNILVDAAASTVQMIGDAAANAVLGTQGSMIPFAARALGGGTQEAREEGADLKHQILYGGAMAAKEVFTEKMFNIALPFSRVYGGGALDDAVERAIGKAVDRFAKTDAGKKLLGGGLTFAASALSEGAEEFVGDWMEWQMPRIYGGDPDSAAETLQNSLYDFLVGAASGAMGGAVNPGTYRYEVKPLSLPTLEDATQQTAQGAVQKPAQDVLREGETQGPAQAETPPEALSLPKLEETGGGQKETAPGMGAANENGLLALTEQEKVNLSSGKKNKIVSTFQEAVSFIKNALSDRQNVDRAYLGKVPEATARKVLNETGVDIRGYNAILPGDAVRHMFKNHGDTAAEAERGQVALTPETAANITAVLSNPDKVTFSKQTDAYGRKTLMFEKKIGDIYITAQAVTDGTKSLTTDTLYIKKGSPTTVDEMQTSPGQTSETSSGLTLTETISQPAGEVNGGKNQQPGGLTDGERAGGTVSAEIGGRETGGQEGADVSGGDRGRISDQGAGGQAGELARGTGRTGGSSEQSRTAVERQNHAKDLRREKISSRELGLEAGTDTKSVISVPLDDWDDGMFSTAERIWNETGVETVYVLGGIEIMGRGGQVQRVRGVYESGKRIIIQADNLRCSIDQIADHEIFHDKAFQTPGLIREIEDKIALRYGREEFNRVVDTYIQRLRGIVDVTEDASIEEIEAAYQAVLEEIYADAYAGINAFGTNAGQFSAAVEETLEDRGLGRRGRETGEATDRTTGPPSSRYSYGGRYANRADSESLAEAERLEMQGLDPEDIRQETGWFRGMDGKWRFEIDDSGMEYSRWGDMNRTDKAEYARFRELEGDGESLSFAGKEVPTYEELIQKPDIQIVDIRGERSGRLSDQRKNFLSSERAKKLYAAPVVNKDTGEALFITPKTITHTFSNLGKDQVALAEHLPEVIREAVLTHGEQSRKAPRDMSTGVFTLFGAVRADGGVQPVKLTVKEYQIAAQDIPQNIREYLGSGVQPQTYASVYDGKVLAVESIEKEEASSSALSATPIEGGAGKYPSASSAVSVKDLLSLVKGDAERYVPKPGGEVRYSVDDSAEEAWANKPKTPLEAVQREIERLRSKEYQERILREEGPRAIVENERTIRGLQKRAEKLMEKQRVNLENTKEPVEDSTSEGTKKKLSPKNKTMMEAIQKELDQRRSEEYKTELLHKGGVNAVVENEREIKKLQTRLDKLAGKKKKKRTPKKPATESLPIIAKQDLWKNLQGVFFAPEGQRAELRAVVYSVADKLLREGALTEEIRNDLFNRLYSSGMVTEAADEYFQEGRNAVAGGRIYVNDIIKGDFGDDWNAFRKRAMANGVYLTNDQSDAGVDVWNQELGETLPGLFNPDELDGRTILERIVQVAEEGRDQKVSLAEYTKQLAGEEYVSEREILDNMERQMDWALRTFAEKADLEIRLRDRTGVKIAQERERFAESSRRQREREALRRGKEREQRRQMLERQRQDKALRELQQKALKQLRWLSRNAYKAPKDLKPEFERVLGDIDLIAVGAANEMNWSKKYNATWRDLAKMFHDKTAEGSPERDPNFLPTADLKKIVGRLENDKIADMDIGALQDLYKAAVGLRTEFYNRNKLVEDEEKRLFAEVYKEAKHELKEAKGGYTGKGLDKYLNLEHLTPMNVFQRMGGWNPNGALYSMAKQLEQGERAARAYTVEAKRQLENFLEENHDWVKRADGQGKDAIWYELEVPDLMVLGMGDKPVFGDTFKVYMTPAQKVQLYLESKNQDNLWHMVGGRCFVVNKELYGRGEREEALAQGQKVRLAPETVEKIVSDLTAEELALARALEQYYNGFAAERINKVSNPLLGYDKAISKNYAPIFTNSNYNRSEPGVFDVTAEGVPHMKGRVQHSKTPSYNLSALDAFERHVDQTSRFVGYAIPVQNMNGLLNWQDAETSMKDAITHKWGAQTVKYIDDLLTELQGPQIKKKSRVEALTDSALSNYISSVFGANPGIVFKQAMSFPLAGTYLGWENVPNIAAALRTDDMLINAYTSELAYRLMGYATPETAQLKNNPSKLSENKFLKFTFGGGAITDMDGWTVKSIWRWAENAVRRENPDLEVGAQEQIDAGQSPFYKEVARRFEEAVSRSQPMYDVMHRPDIMRNGNGITRAATLFKTVPLQQYNMLRQTIAEAQRAKRIYGKKSQNYSEAKKKAGRAVQGVVLATLGIEAVNFLVAMLKNAGKRYRDDDEELTWASVGKEFLSGFMKDSAGMIAGGDVAAEFIGSKLTGDRWYGIETPGITQIQDILEELGNAGDAMKKLVQDGITLHKNGGDLKEYLRRHGADYLGALEEGLRTVAKYFGGIPADNIRGYALGTLRWISPETETAYQDWIKTADKDGLKGLKGEALETRIYDILKNRIGDAERETAKDLAALYAAGYKAAVPSDTPESVTVDGEARKLNAFQKQLYDSVWKETVGGTLDEVTASGAFREADQETRAKMLRDLYSYAGELAKAEVFDDYSVSAGTEKTKEALRSGLDMADYLALKAAGGVDRYLKAAGQGMEAKDATQAALTVSEIKDAAEDKTPKLVLYREALRAARDEDAQMAALSLLMSEGEYARLEAGVFRGITPELYVTARESIAEIDENNSVSQDEAARAIGSMPGLTDEERGVLWQLQNKSWKPEKNPFSVKAGERVYKELQDGGGTLERPEEEPRGLELPRLE